MLETEIDCIEDENKSQSVKDTEDKFTECQTPRKKLQSMAYSPVSLHAIPQHNRITDAKMKLYKVMNTIKSNIPEAYKVQNDSWKDSESDSYYKNDMQEKVNKLVRLHEAMQEKLKTSSSCSEQIQVLTLVPDKLSRNYCSEHFNAFEYLVWTAGEIKKIGWILANPTPKKRKTITK